MPPIAIRRPRLEQLLDARADRSVMLVHGPAGAGKTVLVAQWLTARDERCVWLTVDPSYDDPGILVRHLVEVAGRLTAKASGTNAAWSVESSLDDGVLQDVLGTGAQLLGVTINVVLDGVDRLVDPRSRRLVARLVEQAPQGVRVVLIARSKPRLGLERAWLRDDMVEIGPVELRFRREEIETLAAGWTGRSAPAARLEQSTLGWAAGLRLAQVEASVDDDAPVGLRAPGDLADEYIREELVERSSPEQRSFLEVTCWLPDLTAALCAAIAARSADHPPLTVTELEALPLLPIASRPGTFRYPPILIRALRKEYVRRDPAAAKAALCRAAEACRQVGDDTTALELLLEGDRADDAADVCAELARVGESSLRPVDALLHRRPELVPAGSRWLPWRIRAAVAAGHVDEASSLSSHLRTGPSSTDLSGSGDAQCRQMARAAVAERLGDVAGMLDCAERLLSRSAPAGAASGVDLRAHGWRIRALVWSDDVAGARSALRAFETTVGGPESIGVEVALGRAWVAWLDGDISLIAEALPANDHGTHADYRAEVALLTGVVHRERSRLAPALVHLQEASTTSHNVIASLAASELARCHQAAGAAMDGLELVVSARSSCPELPPAVDTHLRVSETRLRLAQGDLAGAHAVVQAGPPGIDAQLLAARVAMYRAPARAASMLESIHARTPRQTVEKLLLRAQLPSTGATEAAMALTKAIADGEALGLVRTFLDEGSTLCRTLGALALESTDRALGRMAALACQELALAPAAGSTPPIEQLTPRELAVLRMLPLRLSNREMAAQLYISINTLKTYVRAIYRKLEVPHRSAAVRRGKALGLV